MSRNNPRHTSPPATSTSPDELISSFEKFSELVAVRDDDACWNWRGSVNDRGYGVFRLGRRIVTAHRHMFQLEYGRPSTAMVLHTCGRKTCVNPRHLYEGAKPGPRNADAVLLEEIDRAALPWISRSKGTPGVSNPRARLNEEQVRQICAQLDQGVSPRVIGLSFGVDAKTIRNIDQGKTWQHVEEVAQRVGAPRRRRRRGWRQRAR